MSDQKCTRKDHDSFGEPYDECTQCAVRDYPGVLPSNPFLAPVKREHLTAAPDDKPKWKTWTLVYSKDYGGLVAVGAEAWREPTEVVEQAALVEAERRLEGAKETVSQLSGELDVASQRCGAAEKRIEELATELGRAENEAKRVYGTEIDKLEEQLTAVKLQAEALAGALEDLLPTLVAQTQIDRARKALAEYRKTK